MNAYLIGSLRTGGAESAVRNVVKSLSEEKKKRVIVILISDPLAEDYEKDLNVKVINLGATGIFSALPKLLLVIKKYNVVSIHAHLAQSIILCGMARALRSFELICYVHTIGRWKQKPNAKEYLRLMCERVVCNRANVVVYVSYLIRSFHEERLRYSKSNGVVVPNPVFGDAPVAESLAGPLRIVTVGRLEPVKGIEWVMASKWFSDYLKEASWTLVGDGSLFSEIKNTVERLGTTSVRMLGNRFDVPEILATHNVFLLPSWSEGLSVAVLEAMRAGLPIVCTNVGANGEMVKNGINGFLIEPGDEDALLIALQSLEDSNVRLSMGEKSREIFLRDYDPIIIQKKLECLLK